jgi:hypothetical protein
VLAEAQSPRPEDKVEARFFRVMPKEKSDLKSRSNDTEGSPDSILANLEVSSTFSIWV